MGKRQKTFFIFIAVLIGVGLGAVIWNIVTPNLFRGVFYYKVSGSEAKLFLLDGNESEEVVSVEAREVDFGKYKAPRHTYISNNGKEMIYFKKVGEEIIDEMVNDDGTSSVISRIISEPVLVNLKTGKETEIDQPIDSSSLVFSPDDTQIVWVKEIDESTYEDIESSGEDRELWISRIDGDGAEMLKEFDENVILLKEWDGDYIYFIGLWDVSIRSLGRINVKTAEVDYLVPRYCERFLENCQNIEFASLGKYFIYEIYTNEEDNEVTEVYLGDFETREFLEILTTDRISDRAWLNESKFFYTEQETIKNEGVRESIHLVNLEKQTDDVIYEGSYISQLSPDPNGKYLYFLERAADGESFNLVVLNIKNKESEIILTDDYNYILLSDGF